VPAPGDLIGEFLRSHAESRVGRKPLGVDTHGLTGHVLGWDLDTGSCLRAGVGVLGLVGSSWEPQLRKCAPLSPARSASACPALTPDGPALAPPSAARQNSHLGDPGVA
jgi:hypothetical protein